LIPMPRDRTGKKVRKKKVQLVKKGLARRQSVNVLCLPPDSPFTNVGRGDLPRKKKETKRKRRNQRNPEKDVRFPINLEERFRP